MPRWTRLRISRCLLTPPLSFQSLQPLNRSLHKQISSVRSAHRLLFKANRFCSRVPSLHQTFSPRLSHNNSPQRRSHHSSSSSSRNNNECNSSSLGLSRRRSHKRSMPNPRRFLPFNPHTLLSLPRRPTSP